MQKITPFLWYVSEAEEAASFYVALFPDSRIVRRVTMPTDSPSGPAGAVRIVDFELFGQAFTAMSAGPLDPFNHAVSFVVHCDSQQEIDRYWAALLDGGQLSRWSRARPEAPDSVEVPGVIDVVFSGDGRRVVGLTRDGAALLIDPVERRVVALRPGLADGTGARIGRDPSGGCC